MVSIREINESGSIRYVVYFNNKPVAECLTLAFARTVANTFI